MTERCSGDGCSGTGGVEYTHIYIVVLIVVMTQGGWVW